MATLTTTREDLLNPAPASEAAAASVRRWREPIWSYLQLAGLPDGAAEKAFRRTFRGQISDAELDSIQILGRAVRAARPWVLLNRLRRFAFFPARAGSELTVILDRMPARLREALLVDRLVERGQLGAALGLSSSTAGRRLRAARLHVARRLGGQP